MDSELARLRRAARGWEYRGATRPPFAREPGEGQESIWDYPRPPRIEPDSRRVVVRSGDLVVADTGDALRVLETASPPTFYLPARDVDTELLVRVPGTSHCEWKGRAVYWALRERAEGRRVAWSYPEPYPTYDALRGHLAFYPSRLTCFVDGTRAEAQAGDFYGGWITPDIVGPFKGEAGTGGW